MHIYHFKIFLASHSLTLLQIHQTNPQPQPTPPYRPGQNTPIPLHERINLLLQLLRLTPTLQHRLLRLLNPQHPARAPSTPASTATLPTGPGSRARARGRRPERRPAHPRPDPHQRLEPLHDITPQHLRREHAQVFQVRDRKRGCTAAAAAGGEFGGAEEGGGGSGWRGADAGLLRLMVMVMVVMVVGAGQPAARSRVGGRQDPLVQVA